jgi:NAD+ kinase
MLNPKKMIVVGDNLRIGIVARTDLPDAIRFTRKVLKLLPKADVVVERGIAEKLGKRGVPIRAMKVDAIVTIGGDGTVLLAQQKAPDIPVLGINMGGRGFLADVGPTEAQKALRELLFGKLQVRERAKLATEIAGKRLPDALNEAVVRAASVGHMLAYEVLVDGEVVEDTRGDGLIVATPTGSTAYSLAAGGPIVDLRLDALVITPICTSRPYAAPLVVPGDSRIEVKIKRREATVIVDGQFIAKVEPGDKLLLHRSEKSAKFFGWGDEFYRRIREKL